MDQAEGRICVSHAGGRENGPGDDLSGFDCLCLFMNDVTAERWISLTATVCGASQSLVYEYCRE